MNTSLHTWLGACTSEQDYDELPIVPLDVYTAASIGNCASISQALELSPSCLDLHNKGGWTALMYASYYGHHDAIMLLISRCASVHARTHTGCTALMLATMCGHTKVVAALIKSGSLLEVRDSNTWTAVFHAVHSRQSAVLQQLLDCGANANACEHRKGESPLLAACRVGDQTMVEALLRHGADPGLPDYANNTPGSVALAGQHRSIADIITKAVATRGIISGLTDGSAFEDQLSFSSSDGASLQRLLAEAGLAEHYVKLEEQAVNLQVFLTLTDSDLKECGISKLGPRRKMTALIGRWHSNAPLRSAREAAYADRLEVEKQELALKLTQANKEVRALTKKVHQEQELQLSTESLVVEARGRLQRCHSTSLQLAGLLMCLYRAVLNANDSPSDQHTHCVAATSVLNATVKRFPGCESTSVQNTSDCKEGAKTSRHEVHGVCSQSKAFGNGNMRSCATRDAICDNTASDNNALCRCCSDNSLTAASTVTSIRSHDEFGRRNGATPNDARVMRSSNSVAANVDKVNTTGGKHCSPNSFANGEVHRASSDSKLPSNGTTSKAAACKFWNENEVTCDQPNAKCENVSLHPASSVTLKPERRVYEKTKGNKVIDSQTDTIVRLTREAFYLNNVGNVNTFKNDKEQVSALSREAQTTCSINPSDDASRTPANRVELDANSFISDMSHLDLNSVPLPSDYKTRPPQLCVPKLGGPLKECLEMVQELVALSDPNVPRKRAPDIGPMYWTTDDDGTNIIKTTATNESDATPSDERAKERSRTPTALVPDNHNTTSSVVIDTGVSGRGVTENQIYGSGELNYNVNTHANSNDCVSGELNCSNLTDAEKLKPMIITSKPKEIPSTGLQRNCLLVEVTNHPLVDEPTADERTCISPDKISAPFHQGVSDKVHNKANPTNNRKRHVDIGRGKLLHEERKCPLPKSKKDHNRLNITRTPQNNKRKCEFIATPDSAYCSKLVMQ